DAFARVHKCALREVGQVVVRSIRLFPRCQIVELFPGEASADDSCTAKHGQPTWVEAVEAAREKRFDRRWRFAERQLRRLGRQGKKLLRKQGIPSGLFDDVPF